MLVKNAQNLMQAVVKTVQAAESACMKVNSLHMYRLLYVIKRCCSSCMKVSSLYMYRLLYVIKGCCSSCEGKPVTHVQTVVCNQTPNSCVVLCHTGSRSLSTYSHEKSSNKWPTVDSCMVLFASVCNKTSITLQLSLSLLITYSQLVYAVRVCRTLLCHCQLPLTYNPSTHTSLPLHRA